MAKLFGTDGIRGKAGEVLTAELAMKLGQAAGQVFREANGGHCGMVIIGRDTRVSGHMLENALAAGLTSVGVQVVCVGVVPTPAVAFLVRKYKAMAGAVISASHNPYEDNGIKFFSETGHKLPDAMEEAIEAALQGEVSITPATGGSIGCIINDEQAVEAYRDYMIDLISGDGDSLHAVVDCANGAASGIARDVLESAHLEVTMLHNHPNGTNINVNCGSTHLESLQAAVLEKGADVGLAFDGDADRFLAVDENGEVVSGDELMAIFALAMKADNRLVNNQLVVTVMSNLGLKLAMAEHGVDIIETKVGDRYVNEGLQQSGAVLGGEQSGHIIFREYNSTGDGLISAIMLLNIMSFTKKRLSELRKSMTVLPHVLKKVKVTTKIGWDTNQKVMDAIQAAEAALGNDGRILVRASGTENLLRVMVEGSDQEKITALAKDIAVAIEEEYGVQ